MLGQADNEDDANNVSVRVALRVRPLSTKELNERSEEIIRYVDGVPQVIIGKDQTFTFDSVFSGRTKQQQVFSECVLPLVDALFQGYNSTILAYGQTGSGKTHTMGSTSTVGVDPEDLGVIPRVINLVFDKVDRMKDTRAIVLRVSFLELYNEEIRDMLNPEPTPGGLAIRESSDGEVHIPGLFEEVVRSRTQMEDALIRGSMSRTTGSTLMNVSSSRSHAIFTIIVEQTSVDDNEENNISEERNPSIRAKFHFVDLAGSERVKKTKAEGQRLKEGININGGLLALGNVISALGDTRRTNKPKHVPYRDSKLTRMLQSSLGGNSRTLMIACISPADSNFEETLNTLKYAYRARNIMNKPVVNVDPLTKQLNVFKAQIQVLRDELLKHDYKEVDIDNLLHEANIATIITSPIVAHNNNSAITQQQQQQQPTGGGGGSGNVGMAKAVDKQEKTTPLRTPTHLNGLVSHFEESMKISQLEFENNLLQEISNRLTAQHRDLAMRHKALEDAATAFVNAFQPVDDREGEYLEHFNTFGRLLSPQTDTREAASATTTTTESDDEDGDLSEMMTRDDAFADLNNALSAKQEELESVLQYEQLKEEFESKLRELELKLIQMMEERESNLKTLEAGKKADVPTNSVTYEAEKARLTSHYEKKLAELKTQLDAHTRAKKEHQRLMEAKSKGDEKIEDLQADIRDMKKQKSDMLKRMRDDQKKVNESKQVQAKEMEVLKKEVRKSEMLIGQLQNQSKKKDQMLQKKIDESEAFKRKIKEIEAHKQRVIQPVAKAASKPPITGGSGGSNNNSGFRTSKPAAVQAVAPVAASKPKSKKEEFNEANWREWLLAQITKNLLKNEMTESLDKLLGEKEIFVRESSRLHAQQKSSTGSGSRMTRGEYQEQSSFLEMNIRQQNDRIAKVQKELVAISIDCFDSTELMRKVSTTPYERLPQLIQASFELCIEYAEQNRSKRVDQLEMRATSSTLIEGIRAAAKEAKQQTSPISDSKDVNRTSNESFSGFKPKVSPTTTTNVNNIPKITPPVTALLANDGRGEQPASSTTDEFMLEIEELHRQIRQSSYNFTASQAAVKPTKTSSPMSPSMTSTTTTTTTTTTSTTSSLQSKIDQIAEDIKNSSRDQPKDRQPLKKVPKLRKQVPLPSTATTVTTTPPIDSENGDDHSVFDANVLDVDMDTKKLSNSPKGARAKINTSGDSLLLAPGDTSMSDVFTRLSGPRPDSRLKKYRDKLRGEGYRPAIQARRRDPGDTFTEANWSFTGHDGSVATLLNDPGNARFYSGGQDKLVKAWDLNTGDCMADLVGHTGSVKALAMAGDSQLFSGGTEKGVRVWDIRSGANVHVLKVNYEALCMVTSASFVFCGLENAAIKVWDLRTLRPLKTPLSRRENSAGSTFSLAFTRNYLAAGSRDHSVTLYNRDTLEVEQKLHPHHLDGVNCLCVSDDDIMYSGSRDKTIKRWEPTVANANGGSTMQYQQSKTPNSNAHNDWVTCVTQHNGVLYSSGRDALIKSWDASLNGGHRDLLVGHELAVNCIISTGSALLSASSDKSIRLWKV
eukprot:gene11504-13421_t